MHPHATCAYLNVSGRLQALCHFDMRSTLQVRRARVHSRMRARCKLMHIRMRPRACRNTFPHAPHWTNAYPGADPAHAAYKRGDRVRRDRPGHPRPDGERGDRGAVRGSAALRRAGAPTANYAYDECGAAHGDMHSRMRGRCDLCICRMRRCAYCDMQLRLRAHAFMRLMHIRMRPRHRRARGGRARRARAAACSASARRQRGMCTCAHTAMHFPYGHLI